MRTKTINLYSFDELSESSQQKAIENLWDLNVGYEWWESTYEDAKQVGIIIQGFDERSIDVKVYDTEQTAHYIIANHGENCETYKTAKTYLKSRDEVINSAVKDEDGEYTNEWALDNDLDELGEDFTQSIGEDYRIILNKEYEWLTSREQIIESIKANEYDF